MNYTEFQKTYKWMLKKYPETSNIYNPDLSEVIGEIEIKNYTKSGSRWIETGSKKEKVTREYYCNVVDAIPFFRNLGGKETVQSSYTYNGYLPVFISSLNPSRDEKTTRYFKFYK